MVSNSTTGTFSVSIGTIPPFGKPFSFFSIYFTLFRFIFASVYAIIFLNFFKNFSVRAIFAYFSCVSSSEKRLKTIKTDIFGVFLCKKR